MPDNVLPITAGSKAAADVAAHLRARDPLLWIVTREEARAEDGLFEACQAASFLPRFWDCASGVTDFAGNEARPGRQAQDPAAVLSAIRDTKERTAWILRDFHKWLPDPVCLRSLRSLVRRLSSAPLSEARAVIVLSPSSEVPPELAGHALVIEWPLPDRREIADILDATVGALDPGPAPEEPELRATWDRVKATFDGIAGALKNGAREAAVDAAVGLSALEARACYAKSLVQKKRVEPAVVASEKRKVITREKVLEWYDPIPGGLDAVGGLDVLKAWLTSRRAAFSEKARAFGLPAPKGVLFLGPPGTGKSLSAKAVSTSWGMPLLRLDLAGLKSKFVGDSEAQIRKALKVAEAVAPCVVWVDEIEKALAGATSGGADGGVSMDQLGTLLSWMQERQGSVFVIATANDVSALPPELLRKGRFDEIFFVDLPTSKEREAIAAVALRQHGRDPANHDLQAISIATEGFTGAEIAALVPDALFAAFATGRDLLTPDLVEAARRTVPMSKTSAEKIEKLREWAKGRTRPATTPEAQSGRRAPALDL